MFLEGLSPLSHGSWEKPSSPAPSLPHHNLHHARAQETAHWLYASAERCCSWPAPASPLRWPAMKPLASLRLAGRCVVEIGTALPSAPTFQATHRLHCSDSGLPGQQVIRQHPANCRRSMRPETGHLNDCCTLESAGIPIHATRPALPYSPYQMSDRCSAGNGLSGQCGDDGRLFDSAHEDSRPTAEPPTIPSRHTTSR